ncbi:hypothetical protein [Hydrogenothermus marinus]|uniref:Type IV pilus assembly protein PilO n=1 Tax=Hydrogenothermus marinus TaxID=133270 RepID=A0A3M0BIB2_9AQUI|nr:hypothetical protein [Hydrogenothermus marinus]RMA96104.1 hypothetical protein CLV39_1116 [Hydrogenothermus marinus]
MNLEDLKAQWQELENWKKILIVVILTGGILYLIYSFKIEPLTTEKQKLEEEISGLKNQIELLKKRFNKNQIAKLEKKLKEINKEKKEKEEEIKKLKQIIPDKPDLGNTLKTITSNIENTNLNLIELNKKPEKTVLIVYDEKADRVDFKQLRKNNRERLKNSKGILLGELNFEIKLEGNIKDLKRYINNLYNSKRLISIKSLTIDIKEKGTQFKLIVSSYYIRGKEK